MSSMNLLRTRSNAVPHIRKSTQRKDRREDVITKVNLHDLKQLRVLPSVGLRDEIIEYLVGPFINLFYCTSMNYLNL